MDPYISLNESANPSVMNETNTFMMAKSMMSATAVVSSWLFAT